ncbi:ATP-binding protein [Gallaecimonas kandeliae]|uniref:sensor histidine kinase n=1 Tax=Gallaecimonas kandeliae TaxID=3029055 RepID=UPI002648E95E|nr:ATP-binding protein [Gallaecimonas kandeliae]WKE65763.1 ATP-binding protein [Gallaecimonas kandeliae]
MADQQKLSSDAGLQSLEREIAALRAELEALSYAVSHDLRAPLRAMDGFSLALMEEYGPGLDDRGRDYLERIRKAAQRMGLQMDDLLTLSRAGRADLVMQPLDLSAMADQVLNELRQAQPERHPEIQIAPGLSGWGDQRQIKTVLEQLLGNAWKFSANTPTPSIGFGKGPDQGQPCFQVVDNGVGFDMARAGKLFGAFQRLHDARDYPGRGLGLALVQRIIHRHGGRVWAEAAPQQGATFYFSLPGQEPGACS